MSTKTNIEWTDASWNPVVGCSVTSPGCTNCYAMRSAARLERIAQAALDKAKDDGVSDPVIPCAHYLGTTQPSKAGPVWTGKLALAPDHILTEPLAWRRPRRVFVNSMSDLFHESVPDAWIDRVFAVMALAPQHTFQVLTKRAKRMRAYMAAPDRVWSVFAGAKANDPEYRDGARFYDEETPFPWPLPNVWLGVSAEDQSRANDRIPDLLATPAAVRFVSAEPLIGPIDFDDLRPAHNPLRGDPFPLTGRQVWPSARGYLDSANATAAFGPALDWVIVGGESGPGARPMHPQWARDIRDQCATANVPFFFKQWGLWGPSPAADAIETTGGRIKKFCHKQNAGRRLDGREHNAMPGDAT